MLDLHNWGGTGFQGAPSPETLAQTYNLLVVGVDYYQSGDKDNPKDAIPYDFGYLQTMDALRALHFVYSGLHAANYPFDAARIYGAGGSGAGTSSRWPTSSRRTLSPASSTSRAWPALRTRSPFIFPAAAR